MKEKPIDPELLKAKQFHGHLGPYLVVGLRMGKLITEAFGQSPFSYKIAVTVGWKPPQSCIIDGLQLTTPCTIGNSMIQVQDLQEIEAQAIMASEKLTLRLNPTIRTKIDRDTTKANEESFAQEIWEMQAENLFLVKQNPA